MAAAWRDHVMMARSKHGMLPVLSKEEDQPPEEPSFSMPRREATELEAESAGVSCCGVDPTVGCLISAPSERVLAACAAAVASSEQQELIRTSKRGNVKRLLLLCWLVFLVSAGGFATLGALSGSCDAPACDMRIAIRAQQPTLPQQTSYATSPSLPPKVMQPPPTAPEVPWLPQPQAMSGMSPRTSHVAALCEDWCATHPTPWEARCKLIGCSACVQCLPRNITFFVYQNSPLNWLHESCTPVYYRYFSTMGPEFKHSDDFWLAQAALAHDPNTPRSAPLLGGNTIQRVSDPSDADIFVVPLLLNLLTYDLNPFNRQIDGNRTVFCCDVEGVRRCGRELLKEAVSHLKRSEWFSRRQGSDHLLVSSHFNAYHSLRRYPVLKKCSLITFEGRRWSDSFSFPNLNIGRQCNGSFHHKKTESPHFLGVHFIGSIRNKPERPYICDAINGLSEDVRSHSFCAASDVDGWYPTNCSTERHLSCQVTGDFLARNQNDWYCRTMLRTPFILHMRGDTWGSNRLWDAIDNGVIPIFTHAEQYNVLPFPSHLWRQSSVLMRSPPSADVDETRDSLEAAISEGAMRWDQMIDALNRSHHLISWNAEGSRVFEMYLETLSIRLT